MALKFINLVLGEEGPSSASGRDYKSLVIKATTSNMHLLIACLKGASALVGAC